MNYLGVSWIQVSTPEQHEASTYLSLDARCGDGISAIRTGAWRPGGTSSRLRQRGSHEENKGSHFLFRKTDSQEPG